MPKLAYLSLGSNLGNRTRHLNEAIGMLNQRDLVVTRTSHIYETEPRDLRNQPWFLNVVAEAETRLLPRQLLSRVHRIEMRLGRQRTVEKGPRTIDIDILLYGRFVIQGSGLTIPHPGMLERAFVLVPLAELAPTLRHPVIGRTILDLAAAVSSQNIRKLSQLPIPVSACSP